jgi:ornithine lipid hydroxylase
MVLDTSPLRAPDSAPRPLAGAEALLAHACWPVVLFGNLWGAYTASVAGVPVVLISVLVLGNTLVACLLLERWLPFRSDWGGRSRQHQTDGLHIVLSEAVAQVGVRVGFFLIGFFAGQPLATGLWTDLGLGALPVPVQLLVAVAAFDVSVYWLHRIQHEFATLWPLHQIHHSPRVVNALSAVRNHPVHGAASGVLALCFGLTGVPEPIFVMMTLWLGVKGFLQHTNADIRTPWFDPFFQTPEIHRWHHSLVASENNANFSMYLTLWDRVPWHRVPLVGRLLPFQSVTWRAPGGGSPSVVGLEHDWIDPSVSSIGNWWAHVRHPFDRWRELMGESLWRWCLTWGGWPVVVGGCVWAAWALHTSGLPLGAVSAIVAVGAFAAAYGLQVLNPLRTDFAGDARSARLDLAHAALSMGAGNAGVALALAPLAAWSGHRIQDALGMDVWSTLGLGGLSLLVQFAAASVFVELFLFWQHRLMHEIPALWVTHRIHHAIETLGPLRALRHHPLSPMLTAVAWFVIGLVGIPVTIFLMCQAMHASCGALQHSNAKLKLGWLEHVFASPTFHRWHHSSDLAVADRNFAPNLSFMDKVPWHRTPVFGRVLGFQVVTFLRGSDHGPERLGVDETLEDPRAGALANWWHQVTEPLYTWAAWWRASRVKSAENRDR